jgi:SAM-dependent methyltransferase
MTMYPSVPHQATAVIKDDAYFNVHEDFAPYLDHSFQREVEEIFRHLLRTHGPIGRILDVGCASGRTSAFCKRLGVEELVGIEIDPRAASIARRHLDAVILGDAATVELPHPDEHFDMLWFTDVLEHLVDPWATLRRYLRWLRPGGRVLVVLPNFGHIDIINMIISGRLRYAEDGLMDSGHLRLFTQATGCDLLEGAGLRIERVDYRLDSDWQRHRQGPIPLIGNAGWLDLDPSVVPEALRQTLFVRKLHYVAVKQQIS